MSNPMSALTPENLGRWSIHEGEHCGVRIDGPNGRAVLHVIQRDAHPTVGQGITQAESEAIAKRIVKLWNATLTDEAQERAAFEAWALHFKYDLTRSDCNSDEPYVNECTDWSWLAWKQRAAGAGVVQPEPCPRGADKPEPSCTNRHQCWEPCGELGKSEAHVRVGREALLEKGYKADSRCTWLAIGRCAECGRVHDGRSK